MPYRAPTHLRFEGGWVGCQEDLTTEPEDMGQEPKRDAHGRILRNTF